MCKHFNLSHIKSATQTEGENKEFHWLTKLFQALHTPQECPRLMVEYIGSSSASPFKPRRGRLAAIPEVCTGLLC